MSADKSLHGFRVLVVEDETLVAMMVEDLLMDLGCTIVDVVGTLPAALGVVTNESIILDGAVLDVNLGGDKVFPVAEALQARGVPFIFATGYGIAGIEERFRRSPVLGKPYDGSSLETALTSARNSLL